MLGGSLADRSGATAVIATLSGGQASELAAPRSCEEEYEYVDFSVYVHRARARSGAWRLVWPIGRERGRYDKLAGREATRGFAEVVGKPRRKPQHFHACARMHAPAWRPQYVCASYPSRACGRQTWPRNVRRDGRKQICEGEMRVDGVVTASAEGLFICAAEQLDITNAE